MNDRIRTSRLRFVTEVVAIVGSILFAFAIDAWWDGYQARGDERAAFEQLHSEFLANRDALEDSETSHRRARLAFAQMLAIIRQRGDPPASFNIPDSLLFSVGSWQTFDPARGVLTSLISSGGILRIDDGDLRAELTSWLDYVEDLREEEIEDVRITHDQVLPLIGQYVPFVSVEYRLGHDAFPNPSPFEANHRGLLSSLAFENLLHQRLVAKLEVLRHYGSLKLRLNQILVRIEARLADDG